MSRFASGYSPSTERKGDGGRPAIEFGRDGERYRLECLDSADEIARIGSEWMALEAKCRQPHTYFQSFEWCHRWCRQYAGGDAGRSRPALRVFVLRRGGKLVLVWPMMIVRHFGFLKVLTMLGRPHGQYANVIHDESGLDGETARLVWHHIRRQVAVDAIVLEQYPQSSLFAEAVAQSGFVDRDQRFSSLLDFSQFENWDAHVASLSRSRRKQRRLKRNRLGRLGRLGFEVHAGGSREYRELVARALEMKRVWLHQTGRRAGVIGESGTGEFLASLRGRTGRSGAAPQGAVAGVLSLDGRPIAIEIGMCHQRHYYSFLGAFEWTLRDLSPGSVEIEEMQKWAMEAGIRVFDFLGDPADYKASWTNRTEKLESRSVPLSLAGLAWCGLWRSLLRPVVRRVFNAMDARSRVGLMIMLGIHDGHGDKAAGRTTGRSGEVGGIATLIAGQPDSLDR